MTHLCHRKVVVVGLSRLSVRAIQELQKENAETGKNGSGKSYQIILLRNEQLSGKEKELDDLLSKQCQASAYTRSKTLNRLHRSSEKAKSALSSVLIPKGGLKEAIKAQNLTSEDSVLALSDNDLENIEAYHAIDPDGLNSGTRASADLKNKPKVILRCFDAGLINRVQKIDSTTRSRMFSLSALASINFIAKLCDVTVHTTLTMDDVQISLYEIKVKKGSLLVGKTAPAVKKDYKCAVVARINKDGTFCQEKSNDTNTNGTAEANTIKEDDRVFIGGLPKDALGLIFLLAGHLEKTQFSLKYQLVNFLAGIRSLQRKPHLLSRIAILAVVWLFGSLIWIHYAFGYAPGRHHLGWESAFYFVVATATNSSYGSFSLFHLSRGQRALGYSDLAAGYLLNGVVLSLLISYCTTDDSEKRMLRQAQLLKKHFVVIGLGSLGLRIVERMRELGLPIVVIEQNRDCPHVKMAREKGALIIYGDACLPQTLENANVAGAAGVLAVTDDHSANVRICKYIRLGSFSKKAGEEKRPSRIAGAVTEKWLVARWWNGHGEDTKDEEEAIQKLSASKEGLAPFLAPITSVTEIPDSLTGQEVRSQILRNFSIDDKNGRYSACRYHPKESLSIKEIEDFRTDGIRVLACWKMGKGLQSPPTVHDKGGKKFSLSRKDQIIICGPTEAVVKFINKTNSSSRPNPGNP